MPQSLAQIYLHLVFSTKHRQPLLIDPVLRDHVHAYLSTVCNTMKCPSIRVGGISDHVHLLVRFGRTCTVADLIRELKRASSKWIKTQSNDLKNFEWQDGYGAFSVSPIHIDPLIIYIKNQDKHHEKESFQAEYRRLLKKYGLEYDEKYIWD